MGSTSKLPFRTDLSNGVQIVVSGDVDLGARDMGVNGINVQAGGNITLQDAGDAFDEGEFDGQVAANLALYLLPDANALETGDLVKEEMKNVGIEQYDTMEEALDVVPDGNRVFLESTGYNSMNDLPPRDEDVVFVFGCSSTSNAKHMQVNESFRIAEPRVTDMYPTCAGAIVIAYWYGQ